MRIDAIAFATARLMLTASLVVAHVDQTPIRGKQNPDLFDSAVATEKLLACSKWRAVDLSKTFQQAEMYTELPMQRPGVITHDIQTTASGGAFWPEGTDDYMSSRIHRMGYLAYIGETVAGCGKKVKDSSVVPHVIGRGLQIDFRDVGDEPVDALSSIP